MNNVQPFMHFLAESLKRVEQATQRDHIEYLRIDNGAVLRGYYLAGVVSLVEYQAAIRRLQETYEAKLQIGKPSVLHNWLMSDDVETVVGYIPTPTEAVA